MDSLKTYLLADFFSYLVVGARLAGLLFFVPGFAESTIPSKVKALVVIAVTIALTPLLAPSTPPMPAHAWSTVWIVLSEALIGYIAALCVRFLFSALDFAGSLMGYQMGLANAFAMSPASAQQSALPGVFLGTTAILFMLLLDMHHLILRAFVNSYETFPPGALTFAAFSTDTITLLAQAATTSFSLGLQLAAPIIVTGLVFFTGAGLSNRLAPSIQIFFVTQPLQLLLGFFVFFLTVPVLLTLFSQALPQALDPLFSSISP